MLRPHDSLLLANPAFAEVWQPLEDALHATLHTEEDQKIDLRLQDLSKTWTKCRIIWDEIGRLLSGEEHAEFMDSITPYITRVSDEDRIRRVLQHMSIHQAHASSQDPMNLTELLSILKELVVQAIKARLPTAIELDEEIDLSNVTEALLLLHEQTLAGVRSLTSYLDQHKHGIQERSAAAKLNYLETAVTATKHKAVGSYNKEATRVYTPVFVDKLKDQSARLDHALERIHQRLAATDEEILRYEEARTPEYILAADEYIRLTQAIENAEQDITMMNRFK